MGGARPKTLIPIGDHEPLLYYLLKGVASVGVDDLLVVTGFSPADVHSYVDEHWSGRATFVRNARYASWGNFHSVRVAIDQSPGLDLLVLNSDVVVHPDVLARTVDGIGDLVLAVQGKDGLDPEEMRVTLDGDSVVAISKELPMPESHGEFVGVSVLRPTAAGHYAHIATDLEWAAQTSLYYEDVYARMLDSVDARAARVDPGEYAEVDGADDVDAAEAVISTHEHAWEPAAPPVSEPA
jgi:choline kinase